MLQSRFLAFFEKAFGFTQGFLHESGDYGKLNTGETTLAFATHALGAENFPTGYVEASASPQPLGIEIAFVTPSVDEAAVNLNFILRGNKGKDGFFLICLEK